MNETTRLIQERLAAKQIERERELKEIYENSKSRYRIQYCPCGHSRYILNGEHELLNKAQMREYAGYMDALPQPSSDCPTCFTKDLFKSINNYDKGES